VTNLKLISDLHVDYEKRDPDKGVSFINSLPNENVDILVVAGDIVTGGHLANYFDVFKAMTDRFDQTVFVLGNHDNYSSSIQKTYDLMATFQSRLSNFHWLQNERKEIKGQWFAGSTLWFSELDTYRMPSLVSWVDFRYIEGGCHPIFEEFKKAHKFFDKNVDENTIAISHHMPSNLCVHPQYEGDDYNCYFVGEVDDVLINRKPKLWLAGHSHKHIDKTIYNTRFVINARGYVNEPTGFNPNLIIKI
jgi:Icc-related predicted phosphoesterase